MSTMTTYAGSIPATNKRPAAGLRTVVAVCGIGAIAAAACLFTTALTLANQGEGYAFTIPMFVVATGLALWNLLTRSRTASIVAGAAGLANLAVIAPGMYTIGEPESFFDFAPMAWAVAGSLVAAGGGALGVAGRGRRAASTGTVLKVAGGVAAALITVAGLSLAANLATRTSVSAEAAVGSIPSTMANVKFREAELRVDADHTARVLVTNTDPVIHTFTIDELGIDVKVGPGSERIIEIPAAAAGRYAITCAVSGHEKMKSTLVVE